MDGSQTPLADQVAVVYIVRLIDGVYGLWSGLRRRTKNKSIAFVLLMWMGCGFIFSHTESTSSPVNQPHDVKSENHKANCVDALRHLRGSQPIPHE